LLLEIGLKEDEKSEREDLDEIIFSFVRWMKLGRPPMDRIDKM
jgi:hypothetical protein